MSDLSHDARELILVAAREEGPTHGERERLRRAVFGAVAAGGAMLGSASAAGAASSASAAKLTLLGGMAAKMSVAPLAIWFAVGTAAGIATVAPVAAYRYATRPATEPQALHTAAAPASLTPSPEQEPANAVARPGAPTQAEPQPQARDADVAVAPLDKKRQRPDTSAPSGEPADLAVELALLGTAQRELAAGRAERALERLTEHEQRFPSGALLGERLAARVFALCALGRNAEARLAALEFERVAKGSPLTPRVLASCAGKAEGAKQP
jgi:hypothetical protein